MTTIEFRQNAELVRELRTILTMPTLQIALATLRENGPEFRKQPLGMTPTDAATKLGHIYGYAEHHQNLQELAEYDRAADLPEPTYQPAHETDEE